MTNSKPLILDVDGTLLSTDMLLECLWAGLGRAPMQTISSVLRDWREPSVLKAALVDLVDLRVDLLPKRPEV